MQSLKGKLVYCLGRRIPVVHILRFPALKSWYSFACLSPTSLPGMCKYTWNEKNNQKKVFLRWEKVRFVPTVNMKHFQSLYFFFGGVLFYCLPPIEKSLSQYVVFAFISDSMYKWNHMVFVFLCQLISLSIMTSRSICVVTNDKILFF